MGVVYRAHDTRLERDVAVKVLPEATLADGGARKRFRREALSLSRLSHPNIGMVFDFDSDAGVDFLVMELIPGVTLQELLRQGPLVESEVARIGGQIAEALAAAHAQGVIHRDIKPANVRITPDGLVKILDFGLAQAVGPRPETAATDTMSAEGVAAGTVPYMSPEQLRGQRVDARSDLFSLGAVLYEMATGRRPFPEESQPRLIAAILNEAPRKPGDVRGDVDPALERVILRALEKDPGRRYATAAALATDLRRRLRPDAPALHPPMSRAAVRRLAVGAAAVLIVAATATLLMLDAGGLRSRLFRQAAVTGIPSLAVLPFADLSGGTDQEYFADGMTDELITRLSQVRTLKVIARSSAMQYRGTKKLAPQIARELGVKMLLEGTVRHAGGQVRISAELIEAATQRSVWAETFERSLTDVFALQGEIAQAIVENLRARLTPEEHARIAAAAPVNPEAHAEYLKGQNLVRSSDSRKQREALAYFKRAIEIDPGFAAAHSGVAAAYRAAAGILLPPREAMPRARASARRALELDSTLVEARSILGYVTAFYDWRWAEAEVEMKRAIERYPGDALVHSNYGYFLTASGRFVEAGHEYAKAEELDPLSEWIAYQTLMPLYNARRYDATIQAARLKIQAIPDLMAAHHILAQALLMKGDVPGAIASWETVLRLQPGMHPVRAWMAYGYGVSGQRAKARALVKQLEELRGAEFVGGYYMAIAEAGLGDRDRAFAWLEKGLEDRTEDMIFLNVEPGWDVLRGDPRFKALLRRMGFEP